MSVESDLYRGGADFSIFSGIGNLLGHVAGGIGGAITGAVGGILSGNPLGAIGGAVGGALTGSGIIQEQPTGINPSAPQLPQLPAVGPAAAGSNAGDITIGINPPFGGGEGLGLSAGITQGNGSAPPQSLPMVGTIGGAPDVVAVRTRRCPRGQVLAIDGRCYPKQMLPKTFRAWKPLAKPPVTRADAKAIRKADSAKKRLVKLTKQAGAHASMTRPRTSRRGGKC